MELGACESQQPREVALDGSGQVKVLRMIRPEIWGREWLGRIDLARIHAIRTAIKPPCGTPNTITFSTPNLPYSTSLARITPSFSTPPDQKTHRGIQH